MMGPTCSTCGLPLLASRSIESGVCAACHPDGPNIATTKWPASAFGVDVVHERGCLGNHLCDCAVSGYFGDLGEESDE